MTIKCCVFARNHWIYITLVWQSCTCTMCYFYLKNSFLSDYFSTEKGKRAPSQKSNICFVEQNLWRLSIYSRLPTNINYYDSFPLF